MVEVTRVVATLKYLTIYRCSCGASQQGTTAHARHDGSAEALIEFLKNPDQRSHDMPIGWGYNGSFTCPVCTHVKMKREEEKS